MPRRPEGAVAAARMERSRRIVRGIRAFFQVACLVLFFLTAAVACLKLEQFVITDNRFLLPGPPDKSASTEFFNVQGAHFASVEQISSVFSHDFGRSIYLCPIAERRRRLLAIDWVKDASVLRIWPNRLVVRINERTPVAFVQVTNGRGGMTYRLVDSDGVLLDPKQAVKLRLPVLAGMPLTETRENRMDRVKRFQSLQSDLGTLMDKVSEIDMSDMDNLKVTEEIGGRALTLVLGGSRFRERLNNFLDNYPEIRGRLPNATVFDLRLKDRITVIGTEAVSPADTATAKR